MVSRSSNLEPTLPDMTSESFFPFRHLLQARVELALGQDAKTPPNLSRRDRLQPNRIEQLKQEVMAVEEKRPDYRF